MGIKHPMVTLDKGTIGMIRDDYRYSKLSISELSDKWGLPESTISRVLRGL